jgi:hypothetical protein
MRLTNTRQEWEASLSRAAGEQYPNEAGLRHALYNVMAAYCTEVVGLSNAQLLHEGTSSSGRYDTLLGSTLIEFKSPGELNTLTKRRVHAGQALRYLRDEAIGATVVILTDGRTWGILRDPLASEEHQLTIDDQLFGPSSDDEYFQWRPNNDATAGRILDLLDTLVFEPVNPRSLMNKLGPTTSEGRAILSALAQSLAHRDPNGRTDILFRQWVALAGVSYGIVDSNDVWPNSREALLGDLAAVIPDVGFAGTIFTLHTYVALCSKLIAAEALALTRGSAEQRPSQWSSASDTQFRDCFDRLESGSLADEMGAPRMMGGDLFGWYADAAHADVALRNALRGLVGSFAQLAWARLTHATRVSSDLLRDFYTGIVPRGLRKGLGEFFTPQWIAERVVANAVDLSEKEAADQIRFLDPTCGSGTFLVAAMLRSIVASTEAGLDQAEVARLAVESVTGFDINPVSPLMSRVNLLLTLGDLVDYLPEIQFNVFQADSILIPEEPAGQVRLDQAHAELTVPLVIGEVSLPRSLASFRAITGLARITDMSIQRNRDEETFTARLRAELPTMGVEEEDADAAVASAVSLYGVLRQLHIEGRDGVWAHVIEQSFAPRVLKPVDVVVGNPPWISWKNLPKEWRDRSESTWRRWGLWQSKSRGGGTPMADISSLLLARAIATYCPSGIVALLLPEGVLVNEPGGRAIRRGRLGAIGGSQQSYSPIFIDDFTSLNPFADAATKPIALYIRSGQEPSFPIPGEKWNRTKSRSALPAELGWVEAKKRLTAVDQPMQPVDAHDGASKWRPIAGSAEIDAAGNTQGRSYVWGQGLHTRGADGIFICEIVGDHPYPGGLVRVRSRPDLGRNTRTLAPQEALVEARYLWPLVRGANVGSFKVAPSNLYCIVPHDPDSPTKVLSTAEAIASAPRLYDYFEPHFERLVNRSAYDMQIDADHPWGIQGTAWKHVGRTRIMVVCRYMESKKRPPAAVYEPADDDALGFKTSCYPNNKVNFLTCSNLQEADYVAAFVNSEPAQATIARRSSSTTIAPSTLNALALPEYDPANPLHRSISEIGQECRLTPHSWPALANHLRDLVVELLNANSEQTPGKETLRSEIIES